MDNTGVKQSYGTNALLRDLASFLAPYKTKFILGSVFRVASDIAWLYPAYGLAMLTNFLTAYKAGDSLRPVAIIFILQTGQTIVYVDGEGFSQVDLPEKITWGAIMIFAAAVIDFLDGFVARLFKASSEMGTRCSQ